MAHHLLRHKSSMSILESEALTYAEAKGCFSMPSHAVCEDLVQCYFHYVHPTCPIMNIADFLEQYTGGAFEDTSLLLLWSMFSVAANFVSDATLAIFGSTSRAELRKVMYGRAKCLYDLGYEQDTITQIQSALLLGFWYSDLQDHAQSWHWTGVAIASAQTIGLHRDPAMRQLDRPVPASRRKLLANIWWCCFSRDRWLSLGYDRPLRINADDCNVPMVGSDCMMQLPSRAPQAWLKYVPAELSHLGPIWIGLLQLSSVLGDVLAANHSPRKNVLDIQTMTSLDRRISGCLPDKQVRAFQSDVLLFFESHARLHLEATMIALYKPYATEFSTTHDSNPDSTLAHLANGRVKDASTRSSGILDRLIASDMLRFAGPMMIPLLVPSMAVHHLQAKSQDPFTSTWSRSRLDQCLLVLKRLEDNYPAAALVHQLFVDKNTSHSPFDMSRDSVGSIDMSREVSTGSLDIPQGNLPQWQGLPLDIHVPGSLCIPHATAQQWSSPDLDVQILDSDFPELWNFSPPEGKLFFPLDDIHVNRLEFGTCA